MKIQETSLSRYPEIERINGFPDQNVICAFSNRHFNNMSLFYGDTRNSLNNRDNFLKGLGIDYRDLICAKQVHGGAVRYAEESNLGKGSLFYHDSIPATDAFITDKKNLPLAVFTADCLAVFLYDYKIPAIGLVHAGWRGTKERVVSKAIRLMREKFNSRMDDLSVAFGPAIRSCCYEVGGEFKRHFPGEVAFRGGRYYLDLVEINKKQVLDSGVKEENIFDSGICTSCRNEDYFSFRREGKSCGRIMSVMMLR